MLEREKFRFRVRQFFSNGDERVLSFFRDNTLTEDEFLDILLDRMRRECLQELDRVSICQYVNNDSEVLPWIESCEGKVSRDGNDYLSNKFRVKIMNLLN